MLILERIISLFAPHNCLGCGMEGSSLLCDACTESLPGIPSRCYRCKAVTNNYRTCRQCRSQSVLSQVVIATFYDGPAKQLIHHIKYERAQAGMHDAARALASLATELPDTALLCFVPTATSRVRARGFDQAELLQREISHMTGLRMTHLLARFGQTHQVGAGRAQRLHQLDGAFHVIRPKLVRGRDIVLIDDVLTTGATLELAARVLKQAGANSVSALVFAQA